MIDIRKLKELVRLMVENDVSELDLKDQQEAVTVKRNMTAMMPAGVPVAAEASGDAPAAGGGDEAGLTAITSPMVGTFYTSPNPDSPSFVNVGASVGP